MPMESFFEEFLADQHFGKVLSICLALQGECCLYQPGGGREDLVPGRRVKASRSCTMRSSSPCSLSTPHFGFSLVSLTHSAGKYLGVSLWYHRERQGLTLLQMGLMASRKTNCSCVSIHLLSLGCSSCVQEINCSSLCQHVSVPYSQPHSATWWLMPPAILSLLSF